jgi:Polyketide cyclase / dehydrase and lipid transport
VRRGIVVAMKPITVTVDVPQPRERVFAFLDVMRNHERFTDHMLMNWRYVGPDRGVGAAARVDTKVAGKTDSLFIETVSSAPPTQIVEHNVGAGGRRLASGTYVLEPLPAGGTRVSFQYAWREAPRSERLLFPLVRAVMRRPLQRSMERLAQQLATSQAVHRAPAP